MRPLHPQTVPIGKHPHRTARQQTHDDLAHPRIFREQPVQRRFIAGYVNLAVKIRVARLQLRGKPQQLAEPVPTAFPGE